MKIYQYNNLSFHHIVLPPRREKTEARWVICWGIKRVQSRCHAEHRGFYDACNLRGRDTGTGAEVDDQTEATTLVCIWMENLYACEKEFQAWIWRRGTGLGGGKGDCALLKLNCRQWRKSLPPTARLNGVDFLSSSTEAHGRWFMWKYKWYPKLSHPTQSVQRTTPTLHVVREELLTPATTLTPPKKAAFTAAAEICSTCGKSYVQTELLFSIFYFQQGLSFHSSMTRLNVIGVKMSKDK